MMWLLMRKLNSELASLHMVTGSGFGASRLTQNLVRGQKECRCRQILGRQLRAWCTRGSFPWGRERQRAQSHGDLTEVILVPTRRSPGAETQRSFSSTNAIASVCSSASTLLIKPKSRIP
jgi:hypothetical protein